VGETKVEGTRVRGGGRTQLLETKIGGLVGGGVEVKKRDKRAGKEQRGQEGGDVGGWD